MPRLAAAGRSALARFPFPKSWRRKFFRRSSALRVEALEARDLPAVQPLTLTDPRFWGDSGAGPSFMPQSASLSADGQRVVFESDAANLVPNDTNGQRDVFLYDRGSGQ